MLRVALFIIVATLSRASDDQNLMQYQLSADAHAAEFQSAIKSLGDALASLPTRGVAEEMAFNSMMQQLSAAEVFDPSFGPLFEEIQDLLLGIIGELMSEKAADQQHLNSLFGAITTCRNLGESDAFNSEEAWDDAKSNYSNERMVEFQNAYKEQEDACFTCDGITNDANCIDNSVSSTQGQMSLTKYMIDKLSLLNFCAKKPTAPSLSSSITTTFTVPGNNAVDHIWQWAASVGSFPCDASTIVTTACGITDFDSWFNVYDSLFGSAWPDSGKAAIVSKRDFCKEKYDAWILARAPVTAAMNNVRTKYCTYISESEQKCSGRAACFPSAKSNYTSRVTAYVADAAKRIDFAKLIEHANCVIEELKTNSPNWFTNCADDSLAIFNNLANLTASLNVTVNSVPDLDSCTSATFSARVHDNLWNGTQWNDAIMDGKMVTEWTSCP